MRRIGIDVGGTNTDAVLIEEGKVVRAVKAPTSEDVTTGILDSLKSLGSTGVLAGKRIDGVMIGTTHFINAVVQRRHLSKVAALRLGMPASASLPPFCDWPEDLAELVRGGVWMVEGGHEYDGRPFMPLDEAAVTKAARRDEGQGPEVGRHLLDLLAARSQPREARGRAGRGRDCPTPSSPARPTSAASACWSARMPAC